MINTVDDIIASAGVDLLLKEPFYAHLLSSIPRLISEKVEVAGLEWTGQAPQFLFHPEFAKKAGNPNQRTSWVKHLLLHVVMKHLLRRKGTDPKLHEVAADLVVSQLIAPMPQFAEATTLQTFPELKLKKDESLEYYYDRVNVLLLKMKQAGFSPEGESRDESGDDQDQDGSGEGDSPKKKPESKSGKKKGKAEIPEWAQKTKLPESAMELARLYQQTKGDLLQQTAPQSGSANWTAAEYTLEAMALRALDRTSAKDRGTIPAGLLRLLEEYETKRKPAMDWKRTLRLFTGSSYRTKLAHTIKRISKRYGTRPGIRIKKLQRICMAIDTSGSVSERELSLVFSEIRHVWKAGAEIVVVECDAAVQQSYRYSGKVPKAPKGGGGTDFNPVFEWAKTQPKFDAVIYLTDGQAPKPDVKPNCPVLWLILPGNDKVDFDLGRCVVMDEIAEIPA